MTDQHTHKFVRTEEVSPYPGQRHWEYVRLVTTCTCGIRQVGAPIRRLKASSARRRGVQA